MRVFSRTDGLGALSAGKSVTLLRNDTGGTLELNVAVSGGAAVRDDGNDLIISLPLDGSATINMLTGGSSVVKPGGALIIEKATVVGLYTPQLEIEQSDSIFFREVVSNANTIIAREMSYWANVMLMAGLGLSTVAGVSATATVNVSHDSINDIVSNTPDVGTLNIIG